MKYLQLLIAIFTLSSFGQPTPSHGAENTPTEILHKTIRVKIARDPDFLVQILGTNSVNDRSLASVFLDKLIEYPLYRTQTNNWLSQQTFETEDELLKKWLVEHHKTLSFTLWILNEKKVALLHRLRNPIGEIDRKACTEKSTLSEINELAYQGLLNIKDDEISDLASSLALTYVKSRVYNDEQRKNIVAPINIVMFLFREELVLWPEEDRKKINDAYSYNRKRTDDLKQNCETQWLAVQIATKPKAKDSHIFTRSITDSALAEAFLSMPKP